MICGCGCGQETPIQSRGVWEHSRPYWEWYCYNPGCSRSWQLWRNQTGDPQCSWCRHDRALIGHFVPRGHERNHRITATGKRVPRLHPHSVYDLANMLFHGYGIINDHAHQIGQHIPIPQDNRT